MKPLTIDPETRRMIDELLTLVARAEPPTILLRIRATHIMDRMAACEKQ